MLVAILTYGCKKDGLNPADKLLISTETVTDYYPGDSTLNSTVTMQYNSDNTLSSASYNYGPKYYVNVTNFSYDESGNLTQEAFLQGPTSDGIYTFNNQNGIPQSTSYEAPNTTSAVLEATYTLQNGKVAGITFTNSGNVTETIAYNGHNYGNSVYSNGTATTFVYGTHKSQFLYTGYKYCLYGLRYIINDNEILEEKTTYSNGEVNDEKNSYTYNTQGYPLKETTYTNGTLSEVCTYSYTQEN